MFDWHLLKIYFPYIFLICIVKSILHLVLRIFCLFEVRIINCSIFTLRVNQPSTISPSSRG